MRTSHLLASVASLALFSAAANAALVLQTSGVARTISFDAVVNDTAIGGDKVYGYNSLVTYGVISEGGASDTGTAGLRTPSVSYLNGSTWSSFGQNPNGNANSAENITLNPMDIARGSDTVGMVNGVRGVAPLGASNTALLFGKDNAAPWASAGMALRLKNGMGVAMDKLTIGMDAWYGDPDTSFANLVISYSTDNTSYTTVKTLNGARTTTATFDRTNSAHWSANQAFTQLITLGTPIAADGVVYIRLHSIGTNSGGNWLVDNLSFTPAAVPEPGTIGLMSLAGLAMLRRRRA